MKKLESLAELKQVGGASAGNLYWMKGELENLIARGCLYALPATAGNALVMAGERRSQFCFQVRADEAGAFECTFDDVANCVSELIYPVANPGRCDVERAILGRLGFRRCAEVQMMTAPMPLAARDEMPEGFRVRAAGPGDARAIGNMYASELDPMTDNPPLGAELLDALQCGRLWVLASGPDAVCGCLMLEISGRSAWLRHVVVGRELRGRGLGLAFVLEALGTLPEGTECKLWVKMDNAPAIRLYEKAGFAGGRRRMEIWTR